MEETKLTALAVEAKERAYAPYSRFAVGAALECEDGSVYTGCNVENASYGLTICAECTAAVKAVSEGKTRFRRIAIAGSGTDFCCPCGACRQFLAEFSPDMELLCLDAAGGVLRAALGELFPHGFDGESLA